MSPVLSADQPRFFFKIAETAIPVVEFTAHERISFPYEVDLILASEDEISFDDVIGKEALLVIAGLAEDRYIHGIVNRFMQSGHRGRFILYRAKLVPPLWLLALKNDCRIFQNQSIQDIITQVLLHVGITGNNFEFRLKNTYPPKEYCVQYRETDLNFISRLCEEEGIFYFFEHSIDRYLLVFGDSTINYQPIVIDQSEQNTSEILYHPADAMVPEKEVVYDFLFARQIRTGTVTLRDFNFEKPSLDLTARNQSGSFGFLEMYDYPGIYAEQAQGRNFARIRLEESASFKDLSEGKSTCPHFVPGFTFTLKGHELQEFDKEYLLFDVRHSGSQPQVLEEYTATESGSTYSNNFIGIPSSITFRPEQRSHKPVVQGVQTAMVVGPAGEEIYTDQYGRVKVQFHWDRIGEKNENSSCWIRVGTTLAGGHYGQIFTPRIGQEVMVDFLEGDPDKPIIIGSVYNASTMPPYALPDEKTKSTIKSNSSVGGGGFNEIRFEDAAGNEQLFIHAQKDQDVRVVNDLREWIGNESHRIVESDQKEKVQGNSHLTVMGDQNEKINGTVSLESGMDWQQKVGMKHALDAGMEIHLKAGMNAVIEAGTSITLKAGGGFIVVGPAGVTVSGTPILLNSGGSAGSGSGCSPETPIEPQEADKAKPGKDVLIPFAPAELSPQAQAFQAASMSGSPFCEL